jgi:hypothetical protein
MGARDDGGLGRAELEAQEGRQVPDKEAMSLLDPVVDQTLLNLDVDLALDADVAAPINAAVAANANVAAPIDAAVAANIGSPDATSAAVADQDSLIVQDLDGVAIADGTQDSTLDQ